MKEIRKEKAIKVKIPESEIAGIENQ